MEAIPIKQFQLIYHDDDDFREQIQQAAEEFGSSCPVLFHIICDYRCDEAIAYMISTLRSAFPNCSISGASSHGIIMDGSFKSGNIVVTATLPELPTSKIEVLSYSFEGADAVQVARQIVADVNARPWVKAIEALVMNGTESIDDFCAEMSKMREDVMIFGAESSFVPPIDAPSFVIGADGSIIELGIAITLYGGEDVHFLMRYVLGWKPLGRALRATSYEGNLLRELEGEPALQLYQRYLHIENDQNFLPNALDFPFMFKVDDSTYLLRNPMIGLEDGSIALSSAVPPGDLVKIACGDPEEIMGTVRHCGDLMAEFRPDAIVALSCVARRMFWSDEGSSRETKPFQSLAPTTGYYTAGELLRVNGRLVEHNCTLVIVAIREGDLEDKPPVSFQMPLDRRKKSLVSRFSSFIDAAVQELQQANERLEVLSKIDGLTGVNNRREIERIIRDSREANPDSAVSLVMMDLDDFKQTNDHFGHRAGDEVLKRFAALAKTSCDEAKPGTDVGRWGGEEFIVFMPQAACEEAADWAEHLRLAFETAEFDEGIHHTVSLGVIDIHPSESVDAALSRVDEAMYIAKRRGKNQVTLLN